MKLILTGGGDSSHFKEIDKYFINLLGEKPKLLFIPLAGEEDSWHGGLSRIKEVFWSISFDHIEMCIDLSELDWDYLKQFNAIYIDGGNTFELMDAIRDTHTFELVHRFLTHGGVINGDSAGAIVLGSHLETAHFGDDGDDNETEVTSYQGLNLLGPWAIHCHYDESEDEEIKNFSSTYGFPILALHENTAVAISSKELTVVGENKLRIFKGANSFDVFPGDRWALFR